MLPIIFWVQKNRRIAFNITYMLVRTWKSCCSFISQNTRGDSIVSIVLVSRCRLALPVPLLYLSPLALALRPFSLCIFSSSLEENMQSLTLQRDCSLRIFWKCPPPACHDHAAHTPSHSNPSSDSPGSCHSRSIAPAASATVHGSLVAHFLVLPSLP